jgi:hypothetical protein
MLSDKSLTQMRLSDKPLKELCRFCESGQGSSQSHSRQLIEHIPAREWLIISVVSGYPLAQSQR